MVDHAGADHLTDNCADPHSVSFLSVTLDTGTLPPDIGRLKALNYLDISGCSYSVSCAGKLSGACVLSFVLTSSVGADRLTGQLSPAELDNMTEFSSTF